MKTKLSPYDAAFEKLYFVNTINTAGCNDTPIQYNTLYEAKSKLSAPLLWKIVSKLSAEEIKFLNERIERLQ